MATLTAKGLEKRNEILAAADDLFREHGYESTTMRMIAQQVHISCGHLEHYFREKKRLIYELSEIMIDNIWEKSSAICSEWVEEPLIAGAFAVHWLFLICSHLPDLRHITFEYIKNLDNQLVFSECCARHYTDDMKLDEVSKARFHSVVKMAFAAQYCALLQYDDQSFSDEIARRTSDEHVQIVCMLLNKDKEEAARINRLVNDKINEYTIEKLTKPFAKSYRWYVLEGHPFTY